MIQPLQSCSNKYKKGVPKHWSLTTVFRNTLLCQGLIKETENCLLPHDVEYVTVRGIDECAVVLVIELYAVLVEPCAAEEGSLLLLYSSMSFKAFFSFFICFLLYRSFA